MTTLAVHPCLKVCTWSGAGDVRDGLPVFRCSGCGSEWVRTEPWTPAGADGVVAPEVAAEAARRVSRTPTSGGGVDAAGSAGS